MQPRIADYSDGSVAFDPLSGRTVSLSAEGRELVAELMRMIASGETPDGALVDRLVSEAFDGGTPSRTEDIRSTLAAWVELARHLAR